MKTLTLIFAMLFAITTMAQNPIVYVCKFDTQKKANQVIEQIDSIADGVVKTHGNITGYSYYRDDSTAIYQTGYFYNIVSRFELPVLDKYVIYPCNLYQRWGVSESAYKRKQ